jgi:exonuclease III
MLVWNVRGLNAKSHRDALRSLVDVERPSIVCVQETKLSVIDDFIVMQILGTGFDYVSLPADGTRGGVLVAWRSSLWSGCSFSVRRFSISVRLAPFTGGDEWWLTSVYGPATDLLKPVFLAELHDLRQVRTGPWLLCGDFNMIYRA